MKAWLLAVTLGFVMPGGSVLKRLANNRDELNVNAVKIDALLKVAPSLAADVARQLGSSWTTGDLTLNASISIRYPGRCRIDLTATDSTKTMSFVWAAGKKRAEGGEFAALQAAFDPLCALLSPRSGGEGETRAQLTRYAQSLKIDTSATSLGRFWGGVAVVLGQRDERSSQLWVSKDRFVPVRLKFNDDKGVQQELRMVDYSSQSTADWVPRVVELHREKELLLRLTVLSADGKTELEGVKF